jgi:hypothetical protein
MSNISYQDQQQYMPLFSLDKAFPLIAKNDLLYDLSNSFCIFSQKSPVHKTEEDILFAFYKTDLKKEYCKQTTFRQDGDAVKVVRNYLVDSQTEKDKIVSFDQEEPAYSGILHHYGLVEIVNCDHWNIAQVGAWLMTWFDCLKKDLSSQCGFTPADFSRIDLKVKSIYIDALPINLLMQDDTYRFIDLEFNLHRDVELGYIIFRAVYVGLTRLSSIAPPRDQRFIEAENILYAMFSHLGYTLHPSLLDSYYEFEASLVSNVTPVQLKTVKGALSRLRVRPVIAKIEESINRIESLQKQLEYKEADINNLNELVHEKQNHIAGLYHEIHSLSTSRKRMVKQFIKRTLPFLNSF